MPAEAFAFFTLLGLISLGFGMSFAYATYKKSQEIDAVMALIFLGLGTATILLNIHAYVSSH